VINYHHRVFAPLIWLVKIIYHNISIFYTAHNVFDDYRNLLLTADTFVAVSEASKRDLQRSGKKNIVVLTHGIETIQRTRHRQRNRTIGYIGRLERHKGILCLLDAMRILVDKNMGYKLILRGEGPLEKEILRRREDLRIEKQVALDPPRIHEDEILDNIDLLVLPSFVLEGFGLVLVEAMREGIPVVGSNIGGINEVITDGFNGRLVEPGNPRQLADTIQEIFDDEVKKELLVANGRKTAKDKYSLERYLTDYRQLLLNI
jgi:glycosyltransferase involved in cell wall biosynthesis